MLGRTGRIGTALASVSLLGAVILGASASGGTGPATATTTAPDVRAQAQQMKLVAPDLTVVVLKNTGHWILEENPKETTDALVKFL